MKRELKSPKGNTYTIETIDAEIEQSILKNNSGEFMEEYTRLLNVCEGSNSKAYLLNDGCVAVFYGGPDGTKYSSYEGFLVGMKGMIRRKKISKSLPKLHIAYLPRNEKIFYHQIDEIEGEIISEIFPEISKNSVLRWYTYKNEVGEILEHRVPESQYLLFRNEADYSLFSSHKNVLDTMHYSRRLKLDRGQTNIPIACRNPYGDSFPDHVDELATQLPRLLNISEKELTPDYKGLNYLQRRLFRNLITADFGDRIFLPLYAYYSKTFIETVGGKWVMHQEDVADSWVPDIEFEGELIQLYDVILINLDHNSNRTYPLSAPFGKFLNRGKSTLSKLGNKKPDNT